MVNPIPFVPPPPPPPPLLTPEQVAALTQLQVHMLRPGLVLEVLDPASDSGTSWVRVKEVYAGRDRLAVLTAPHDGPPEGGVQVAAETGSPPPPRP